MGRAKSRPLAFLTISQVEGNERDATLRYFFFSFPFFSIYREIAQSPRVFFHAIQRMISLKRVYANRDATGFLYRTFSRNALYNSVCNYNWK